MRPRDCATHEIQNRKDQKTEDKGPKEKDTLGAKFLGYSGYPEGRFFGGCQTLPLEDFFTTVSDITAADRARFQTSPPEVLFPGEINPKISTFYRSKKKKKHTKPEIFPFLIKISLLF